MTETREIETRMLNLLRDFNIAKQYIRSVRPRLLSPEGKIIFLSLSKIYATGIEHKISVRDLWLMVKTQFPNHDLSETKKVLLSMKQWKDDSKQPAFIHSLFTKYTGKMLLQEISTTSAAQMEAGKYDLNAIRKLIVDSDPTSVMIGPEAAEFDNIVESGLSVERIGTGLVEIDRQFQGGIARKELGIVAGPPKRGKSAMLVNIGGAELLRRKSILYISLADLFRRDVIARFAVWLTQKPLIAWLDLTANANHSPGRITVLKRKTGRILKHLQKWFKTHGHRLYVLDWTSQNTYLEDIERAIVEVKQKAPELRLVIIDRAETITVPNKYGVLRHDLKTIYTEARRIAGRQDVALWVDSQADSRAYTSKRVGMDKASEDKIGKAGVTDLWIGLTRDREERNILWLTLDGRRKITQELHCVRLNQNTFRLESEDEYEGE